MDEHQTYSYDTWQRGIKMSDLAYFGALAIALCLGLLVGFALGFEYRKKRKGSENKQVCTCCHELEDDMSTEMLARVTTNCPIHGVTPGDG